LVFLIHTSYRYFLLYNVEVDKHVIRQYTNGICKCVQKGLSWKRRTECSVYILKCHMSRDSSVGIATRYGLDGPGIESLWVARFSAPIRTGSEAHPASYTAGTGSFPGVKRSGRGVRHPPVSNAEIKERVELYLCSPSGPLWPVLGWVRVLYICIVCVCVRACLRARVCVCLSLCPRQRPEVSLFSRKSRLAVGPHPASFSVGIWDLFPLGVKCPGHEADHFSLVPT